MTCLTCPDSIRVAPFVFAVAALLSSIQPSQAQISEEIPVGWVHVWQQSALGDLDGDGRQDLIVVVPEPSNNLIGNYGSKRMAWFRGQSAPPYFKSREPLIQVDSHIWEYVVADFDNDGADDLLVYVRTSNRPRLAIARGVLGAGGVGPLEFIAELDYWGEMFVADIDGDGWKDVVGVFDESSNASGWIRNPGYSIGSSAGKWTIQSVHEDAVPLRPFEADSDETPELLSWGLGYFDYIADSWELVRAPKSMEYLWDRRLIGLADANQDGRDDLLVSDMECAWFSCNVDEMQWISISGQEWRANDPFDTWENAPTWVLSKLHFTDVLGNGHLDIVTAGGHAWFHNGTDNLGPDAYSASRISSHRLIQGLHINDDETLDWITASTARDDWSNVIGLIRRGVATVLSSDSDWSDGPIVETSGAGDVRLVDLDDDGDLDIVHGHDWRENWDGLGFFTHPQPVGASAPLNAVPVSLDEIPGKEWVWLERDFSSSMQHLWIAYRQMDGAYNRVLSHSMACDFIQTNPCVRLQEPWDVDADGDLDLTMAMKVDGVDTNVWLENVRGGFSPPVDLGFERFFGALWRMEDGRGMAWDLQLNQATYLTPDPDSPGSFFSEDFSVSRCLFPTHANRIIITDIDGNGMDDIVCVNGGTMYSYRDTMQSPDMMRLSAEYDIKDPTSVDLNQNGRYEIVGVVNRERVRWEFSEDEEWVQLPVPASLAYDQILEFPPMSIGDLNGDGIEDIVRRYGDHITLHFGQYATTTVTVESAILPSETALDVWPNPFENSLAVQWDTRSMGNGAMIVAYDILGRRVFEQDVYGSNLIQIDTSDWAAGSYFVRLASDTGSLTKMVVRR